MSVVFEAVFSISLTCDSISGRYLARVSRRCFVLFWERTSDSFSICVMYSLSPSMSW
ncbi:MAG: hypothetical protein HY363_01395 [Candidatus Aenigmarchaeota archaeon]|nr:hypothetical protein [Candidatus Aenigmarchaeota archaeon]